MNFILKISPPFLRKLDDHLRINHTWIWTTRIHLHIYLSVLGCLFFSLIGMLYRIDITEAPGVHQQDMFLVLLFIPAVILGFFMIYNMSLFNSDKSQGYRFRYQEVLLFLVTFFSFCLPLLIPFSAAFILNERIAGLEEDKQFLADETAFNEGMPFFPSSPYNYQYFPSDSTYLLETVDYTNDELNDYRQHWSRMRDSIFWHRGVFRDARPYLYYTEARTFGRSSYNYRYRPHVLSYFNRDSAYTAYLRKINIARDPAIIIPAIAGMDLLLNKYSEGITVDRQLVLKRFMNHEYKPDNVGGELLETTLNNCTANIYAIEDAKCRNGAAWQTEVWMFLALFIFCFTIVYRVYKNVHWQQLLIAVAIIIGGLSIIAIFEDAFRTYGNIFLNTGMFLPLVLLFLSIKGFSIRSFSWVLSQANILLSGFLPFYPVIILYYLNRYFNILECSFFDRYKEILGEPSGYQRVVYNAEYYRLVKTIWFCTFSFGILSYVFIWNCYLKALYLRYWSLPKNK
ncbi:MAG: hypothetical protein JWO09_520 [Bacteroidetes bacterium]|nr:hypothetical protein [Bacteroidota bacterium]